MSGKDQGVLASVVLALRSLLWVVLLPGIVAGYVPWRYFGVDRARVDVSSPASLAGAIFVVAGVALLAACVFEFARSGRGTLSPADPPRLLVVRGLYRYVRNPMYLSVTLIVLGEALLTSSIVLTIYWAIGFFVVNVFVIAYEEPTLRRSFGASYDDYCRRVRRWIPRFRTS